MKISTTSILLVFMSVFAFSQSPERINYQAVARDLVGNPLINTAVNLSFEILQGSASGAVSYSETQVKTTNKFGLFTAEIGGGTVSSGAFPGIAWGSNTYFLRITVNGDVMPATQLLSVPYALYSKESGNSPAGLNGINCWDTNTNGVDDPSEDVNNDTFFNALDCQGTKGDAGIVGVAGINGLSILWLGTFTTAPGGPNTNEAYYNSTDGKSYIWDGNLWTQIAQDGTSPTFIAGNGITIVSNTISAADESAINELQTLNIVGNSITISDGNTIVLPNTGIVLPTTGNTVGDVLKWNGIAWIAANDSTEDQDADPTNEFQDLSYTRIGDTTKIDISDGVSTSFSINDADADSTNEIQMLSFTSPNLSLSRGGGIVDLSLLAPSVGWSLAGNAGTSTSIDFIGTTDAQDLDIRTNNALHHRFTQNGQLEFLNTGKSVFIGEDAGRNDNLVGSNSVFIGYKSGFTNISTQWNVGLGYSTLENNTLGASNTAIGSLALRSNTTGGSNTAVGIETLQANTSGSANTAIGYRALYSFNGSNYNTAIGAGALQNNVTGSENTALGGSSLTNNTTGSHNVGLGMQALNFNTSGYNNVAIGYLSLQKNIDGFNNTAIGLFSLQYNTSGNDNTAIGRLSLNQNTTGVYNLAAGVGSLQKNIGGGNNAAFGSSSLNNNTSGDFNVGIGYQAGMTNTGGSENIFIGKDADAASDNLTNAAAIGANTIVESSNSLILGNDANIGIGTSSPVAKLDIVGSIKITDGSEGANKVLTSDASGLASWGSPVNGPWSLNGADISYGTGNVGVKTSAPKSTLEVNGSFAKKVLHVTASVSVTLDGTSSGVIFQGGGSLSVVLPDANTCEGRIYHFTAVDGGNDEINISAVNGSLIYLSNSGGSPSETIVDPALMGIPAGFSLISIGSGWVAISRWPGTSGGGMVGG